MLCLLSESQKRIFEAEIALIITHIARELEQQILYREYMGCLRSTA